MIATEDGAGISTLPPGASKQPVRRHDCLTELDRRLRLLADLEADLRARRPRDHEEADEEDSVPEDLWSRSPASAAIVVSVSAVTLNNQGLTVR